MILSIDTATRWTGLALHDGKTVIAELGWRAKNTQTQELAPTVVDMLRKTDVSVSDLKGIGVAIGPGSYTGLRVGVGFAKGMALAQNIPLFGVNTLDVIMAAYGKYDEQLYIVPVCEAGRKRVCAAQYRWYSRKGWQVKKEADIFEWDALIKAVPKHARFVGELSAEACTKIRASTKSLRIDSPAMGVRHAAHIEEIAHKRLRKQDFDDSAELSPIYLREPGGGKAT